MLCCALRCLLLQASGVVELPYLIVQSALMVVITYW